MSKSLHNTIDIFNSEQNIEKQILNIKTSSIPFKQEKLTDTNLFKIFSFLFKDKLEFYYKSGFTHHKVKLELFKDLLLYFKVNRTLFFNITDTDENIL